MSTPAVIPVITPAPVIESSEPEVLHVPPDTVGVTVADAATQIVAGAVMVPAEGRGLILIVNVLEQAVASV